MTMINRRNFLSLAALAIAGKAAERVFPFRVYSIPKEIVIVPSKWDQFLMESTSFSISFDINEYVALLPSAKNKLGLMWKGLQCEHAEAAENAIACAAENMTEDWFEVSA